MTRGVHSIERENHITLIHAVHTSERKEGVAKDTSN